MRQPAQKLLKESKGIQACKQKFIQEQNKLMWMDPMMLNEAQNDAGTTNYSNAPAGGSTSFITGHSAESQTVAWVTGDLTASNSPFIDGVAYFDLEGMYPIETGDFTADHVNSTFKVRCFFTTGSVATLTKPAGYEAVVTASIVSESDAGSIVAGTVTSSILLGLKEAINNTVASSLVGGVRNGSNVGVSTLFTATTPLNASSLTIVNDYKGSVDASTISYFQDVASGSFTISTGVAGRDTFHDDKGSQTFDGGNSPYKNMPRKSN